MADPRWAWMAVALFLAPGCLHAYSGLGLSVRSERPTDVDVQVVFYALDAGVERPVVNESFLLRAGAVRAFGPVVRGDGPYVVAAQAGSERWVRSRTNFSLDGGPGGATVTVGATVGISFWAY